jgi:hypothetical protein
MIRAKLRGEQSGPGDQQAQADVDVGVLHGDHVQVRAIGVSHMKGVDLQVRKIPGHVVELNGQGVLAFSRRHPGKPGMDVQHDPEFLGLFIKRPDVRIIDVGVFGRIEFKDFAPFSFTQYSSSQMVFFTPLYLMGEILG